jgi:glycosyltransferase involved in cell wall biosynthesis
MNVIHVVPSIANEASGPSYSVVRLCQSLISEGTEVSLATIGISAGEDNGGFVKRFPFGLGPKKLGRSPLMARWIEDAVKRNTVDMLHNHSLWMMPNVYPGRIAKRTNVSYVVSPRGTLSSWSRTRGSRIKKVFWPMVQAPSLRSVSCFHATAHSEYEDIRSLGFDQPVAVIPNGVDVGELRKRPPGNQRTLLFLGRLHPKKGLDLLMPAWSALQDTYKEWSLRIVGPSADGYENELRNLSAKYKLKRVEFSGALYGEEKHQAYADADVFILPTYSENFGMSVAEALANATPAIVTQGAPWHGLQVNGAGWWIETNLDSLIASMRDAMDRPPDELMRMGMAGREWMKRDFAWDAVARKMNTTYSWILSGGLNTTKPYWVISG